MLLWVGGDCYAGGQFVKIKQAQLSLQDNKARLSIKLDFQLNPSAEEALYSGIPYTCLPKGRFTPQPASINNSCASS
jgi:hypothetical protein